MLHRSKSTSVQAHDHLWNIEYRGCRWECLTDEALKPIARCGVCKSKKFTRKCIGVVHVNQHIGRCLYLLRLHDRQKLQGPQRNPSRELFSRTNPKDSSASTQIATKLTIEEARRIAEGGTHYSDETLNMLKTAANGEEPAQGWHSDNYLKMLQRVYRRHHRHPET